MSALDDVIMLSSDGRTNTISFESTLEEIESSLEAQKKAIQFMVPKDPIIGVPPGTALNAKDDCALIGADLADNIDDDGAATEEEGTRQVDDSSDAMDDMVGELDDSGEELEGSGDFV